jgi:ubiquinone/menaquinone biosynthesis C-methylase UbiE
VYRGKAETSRLESMHAVLSRVFDGRLIFPPVRNPKRILDLGTGSGDWAIQVAEQYPESEVSVLSTVV